MSEEIQTMSGGTEVEIDDLETVERALLTGEVRVETDPDVISREIVRRILTTEDPESVFAEDSVYHARDLLERPLRVLGVRWFPSSYEGGPSVYAAMDAVLLDTGERVVVTIGAVRALAQLLRAQRDGLLPRDLVIRQTMRPTAAGYYPLYLAAAERGEG
jgi:hypothetical protein